MMVAISPFHFALLALTSFAAAAPSPDSPLEPFKPPTATGYTDIRTDDAAWQAACGRTPRVGAVCLNAMSGSRPWYKVETRAQQNVVFSGGANYLMAYCPVLDKGEKPYKIMYGFGNSIEYYDVLGRKSNERCCKTQYIDSENHPSPVKCIFPTTGDADDFPPDEA